MLLESLFMLAMSLKRDNEPSINKHILVIDQKTYFCVYLQGISEFTKR